MFSRIGWIDDRVLSAEPVPWWLGVAGYDPATRRTRLLPVPVNVVWRVAARWWWKLRDYSPERQRKAYWRGFNDGLRDGQYNSEQSARRVADMFIEATQEEARQPKR